MRIYSVSYSEQLQVQPEAYCWKMNDKRVSQETVERLGVR